jgi:hypothetical protein
VGEERSGKAVVPYPCHSQGGNQVERDESVVVLVVAEIGDPALAIEGRRVVDDVK